MVAGLRSQNVDLITVFDCGLGGHPDSEQLEFAAQAGRMLYSLDVADFCRLHQEWQAQGQSHAGIILVPRQRCSARAKIRRLLELIDAVSVDQMRNTVRYI